MKFAKYYTEYQYNFSKAVIIFTAGNLLHKYISDMEDFSGLSDCVNIMITPEIKKSNKTKKSNKIVNDLIDIVNKSLNKLSNDNKQSILEKTDWTNIVNTNHDEFIKKRKRDKDSTKTITSADPLISSQSKSPKISTDMETEPTTSEFADFVEKFGNFDDDYFNL